MGPAGIARRSATEHAASKFRAPPHRAGPLERQSRLVGGGACHLADRDRADRRHLRARASVERRHLAAPHRHCAAGRASRTIALWPASARSPCSSAPARRGSSPCTAFPAASLFDRAARPAARHADLHHRLLLRRAVRLSPARVQPALRALFGWHTRQGLLVPGRPHARRRHPRDVGRCSIRTSTSPRARVS